MTTVTSRLPAEPGGPDPRSELVDHLPALRAFALHPLVDSVSTARRLLAGYRAASPEVDALLS